MKLDVIDSSPPDSWYAQGLNFTCTQCGNCCTGKPGFVWISEEEIGRLAVYLGLSEQETRDRYCRRVFNKTSLNEQCNSRGEYDCVFLIDIPNQGHPNDPEQIAHTRRGCSIYSVRPLQCRTWPFWEGNLGSKENWDHSSLRCHGMNRGRRYGADQIEALRDAKEWPLNAPTSAAPLPGDKPQSQRPID